MPVLPNAKSRTIEKRYNARGVFGTHRTGRIIDFVTCLSIFSYHFTIIISSFEVPGILVSSLELVFCISISIMSRSVLNEFQIRRMESRNRKLEHVDSEQSYEADSESFARHNILCENKGLWTLPESFPQVCFSLLISFKEF